MSKVLPDAAVKKHWTHLEAFAFYGTTPPNVRYSWSAVNDGVAVITAWADDFTNKNGKPMYHRVYVGRHHCNGEMRVILAGAVDPRQLPRKIAWCEPRPQIKLKIVSFDPKSGEL